MKGYTDFFDGLFFGVGGVATKPIGKTKYMDWRRAHKIIEERAKENNEIVVYAGLVEDWNNTAGVVFENGKFTNDGYVYAASVWATPILDIDGEEIECYTTDEPEGFTTDTPSWWDNWNV